MATTEISKIKTSDNVEHPIVDRKVVQNATTASNDYRVLLSYSANDTEEDNEVNKNANLRFNPGTQILSVGGSITASGDLTLTGNATLNNQVYAEDITTNSLLVNGNSSFVQSPTAPTPAANDSSTKLATTEFVTTAFTANDAMVFKGVVNANADLPATHSQGWTYRVATAGTYANKVCEVGDIIICVTDGTTANNDHWAVIQNNVDGAIFRGANAFVDNNIIVADSTAGKVKSSGVTITNTAPSASSTTTTIPSSSAVWAAISGASGYGKVGTVTTITAGAGLNTTSNDTATDGGTITSSGTLYLTKSGATAGSYGPSANVTGSNGTTMSVPYITVDKYGRVTSISNKTYTAQDTTYSAATTQTAGLMTANMVSKLEGIATGANAYSLPTASSTTLGGIKVGTGLSIGDTGVLAHSSVPIGTTSSQGSSTTRHYIKTITIDSLGHITGVTTGAETVTNTDRYVNTASFADDSGTTASPVKMTLTRAGSDTATVTANIPKVSSSSAGVVPKGAAVSTQSQTTKFLREDGTWAAPSYTTDNDTKNTAGSSDTTSKIFLVGATSQTASAQTYSDSEVYVQNGSLYLVKTQDLSGTANNKPALIVGGADTAAHLEIDANEIQAKATGTTTTAIYLNNDGGAVYINNNLAGKFTATPTSGQVVVTDGTGGGMKSSGYTIATSVPSGAVFTDTKVTQNNTTTNSNYRILLSYSASDTAETNTVNKNGNLLYNPSTQLLSIGGSITGTGGITMQGPNSFSGETQMGSLTTTNLLVNGGASFNNNVNFTGGASFSGTIPTSITPDSSSNDSSIATTAFVKNNLGSLSGAMHFIGITSTELSDGATTTTLTAKTTGSLTKTTGFVAGDVVLYNDGEYVWTGSAWEQLGDSGSFKIRQTAITDNTGTAGTTAVTSFLYSFSQDANGVVSTKSRPLPTGTTSVTGIVMLSSATNSSATNVAATPSAVKAAYDLANSKSATTGTVTSVRVQATSPVVSSSSAASSSTLNTTISLADNYGDTKNPYASKTANYVLASGTNAAAVPTFRKLVAADIPSLTKSKISDFPTNISTFTNDSGYVTSSGVTSITLKAGTGISLDTDNTAITTSGTRTITNSGVRATTITGNYLRVNTNGTDADLIIPYATKAEQDADGYVFPSTYIKLVAGQTITATSATHANLNDLQWQKTGSYAVPATASVPYVDNMPDDYTTTLTDHPAFMMNVYAPLSSIGSTTSGNWIYRIQEIIPYNNHVYRWRRMNSTNGSGTWSFGTWTRQVLSDSNTDTKVTQAAAITTAGAYPIILGYSTATTALTNTVNKSSNLTYNPSTKALSTGGTINGYTLAAASAKGVDNSISAASTSTNLPSSSAVAAFVEGKGYATTSSLSNYVLKTGDTMSGNLNFSNGGGAITWNSDTYQQRIQTIDDSTTGTNVFVFQQSSNSGSSWTNLASIKDDGTLVASTALQINEDVLFKRGTGTASLIKVPTNSDGTEEASGTNSICLAPRGKVSGNHSILAGTYNSSNGDGYPSISGNGSFGCGLNVKITTNYSAAIGQGTEVSGNIAQAFGNKTISTGRTSMVIGSYNIQDTTDTANYSTYGTGARKYLFIIGNGTANDARSNAMTVDWAGDVNAQTSLSVASAVSMVYNSTTQALDFVFA